MRESSKTYKITKIINEDYSNKEFTINDILDFANNKYKNIKFSRYSIGQYCNHYVGWGFLDVKEVNKKIVYNMKSQIPMDMSTYLIREFSYKSKDIQREKLEPFLMEYRRIKLKKIKDKIDG